MKPTTLTTTSLLILMTIISFVSGSDLSDYPEPFFVDGKIDAIMVSGEDASPSDLLGLIEIAHSMQYSAVVQEVLEVETAEPFVTGDAVKAWREGDLLEINELIGDVTETYDAEDALALESYVVSTEKGATKVNQYLRFSWGDDTSSKSAAKVVYTEDDDSEIGDFLWFEDGGNTFQYELEFESGLKSAVDSGELPDLEGRTLNILGDDFSIVDAKYSASEGVTLTLMGGAVEDILGEGETRTYEVDGREYEVTLVIVSDWPGVTGDAKLKFKVNGVLTKELSAGDTTILQDGTALGVKEVLPNEAGETTGGDIVSFYLGAYKVEFSDAYASGTWDGTVEVDGDNVEDASLLILYNTVDDDVALRKISYRLATDAVKEGYIPSGSGLRSFLREPEGMLGMSWDVRYEGLSAPGYSKIDVVSSGDDEYRLRFENTQGVEYTVRLAYANSTGLYYGDDDRALVFSQGTGTDAANFTVHASDYFVVSHNGRTDKGVTRVLQFDSFDTSEGLVMLTDVGTGSTITSPYSGTLGASWTDCQGEFNIGGYTFDYYCVDSGLLIDLDDDGSVGGESSVVVNGGGIIDLGAQAAGSYRPAVSDIYLNITTLSTRFNERDDDESFGVNITASSSEVDLEVVSSLSFHSEDSDEYSAMSDYGVLIVRDSRGNDPDKLYVEYPREQVLPQVYLAFDDLFSVAYSTGTVVIETYPDVPVGSAYSGEQPSDLSSYNIVSVGGPCVNAVTAELMALDYPACGRDSGLKPGEGFIGLYNDGKALVIAGWDESITRELVDVLLDYEWYQMEDELKGNSYVIS